MSSSVTATATAAASSSAAAGTLTGPPQLKIVGVILAVASGLLIGASFVFKKKGLVASQAGHEAGEGVAYLKSPLWWTGMVMMILGEICNFAAYAFVDAVVVTPMGALSVVVCAILSSIFLKETLTFFGWVGCFLCIVGSVIIALNGPEEAAVDGIRNFQKLFLAPGFLVFGIVIIVASLAIVLYFAPKYGKNSMLWYISVCSLVGGLSVSCTQGLGNAIVLSAMGRNQFNYWFTYFLLIFVAATLLVEIYYLNIALALYNTAMVTPTYYVVFTSCTIVTSIILYQGLRASIVAILTLVMGFMVICAGVVILQMSKVDPESLGKLDRKSTLLLQASRRKTEFNEKNTTGMEDPGIDALRSFGTVGSIIRARTARRMSRSSAGGSRSRHGPQDSESGMSPRANNRLSTHGLEALPRHQLYDAPMPRSDSSFSPRPQTPPNLPQVTSVYSPRSQTIKFGDEEVAHYYPSPGLTGEVRHDVRRTEHLGSPPQLPPLSLYPDGAMAPKIPGSHSPFDPERTSDSSSSSSHTAPATQTQFARQYSDPFASATSDDRQARTANPFSSGSRDSIGGNDSPDMLGSGGSSLYSDPFLPRRASSGRSHRYPKGSRDLDQDESQRLVDRQSGEGSPPDMRPGGIRLLPSLPRRDF